jgi:hypothetical protein
VYRQNREDLLGSFSTSSSYDICFSQTSLSLSLSLSRALLAPPSYVCLTKKAASRESFLAYIHTNLPVHSPFEVSSPVAMQCCSMLPREGCAEQTTRKPCLLETAGSESARNPTKDLRTSRTDGRDAAGSQPPSLRPSSVTVGFRCFGRNLQLQPYLRFSLFFPSLARFQPATTRWVTYSITLHWLLSAQHARE